MSLFGPSDTLVPLEEKTKEEWRGSAVFWSNSCGEVSQALRETKARLASAEEVVSMIEEQTTVPYLAKKTILLNRRARAHFEKFKVSTK